MLAALKAPCFPGHERASATRKALQLDPDQCICYAELRRGKALSDRKPPWPAAQGSGTSFSHRQALLMHPPPPLPYSTVSLPISAVFFLDSFFFRPALVSSQPTRTAVTSSPPKMRVSHRSSVGRGESPAVSTCRCLYLSIRLGWKSRERSAISGGSSCRCGSPRPWGSPLCTDPNFPPATNAHYSERCPPPYRSPCRSYTTMFLG